MPAFLHAACAQAQAATMSNHCRAFSRVLCIFFRRFTRRSCACFSLSAAGLALRRVAGFFTSTFASRVFLPPKTTYSRRRTY